MLIFHNIFYFLYTMHLKRRFFPARCLPGQINKSIKSRDTWRPAFRRFKCIVYKTNKNIMKYQLYTNASKNSRWQLFVISEWFVWNWLIILRPKSNFATFWICMISSDHIFRRKPIPPFIFRANSPFYDLAKKFTVAGSIGKQTV